MSAPTARDGQCRGSAAPRRAGNRLRGVPGHGSRRGGGRGRVVALFGAPRGGPDLSLFAIVARSARRLAVLSTVVGDAFPSMAEACPQLANFEREVAEQWGVRPEGHPWWKPLRYHASWRPGRDAWGRREGEPIVPSVAPFFAVSGEEVHEVAVGPVHAGIIEPGHFRFQCHGETVLHLEISLGYQHRGVERALLGGPDLRTIHYMETAAGDTTVGHALAYAHAVEALSDCDPPGRAHALRAVALELERLANHAGDLGALAGDVGYLPTASYCGRIRGDFLNLTALVCGSRLGRGWIRPGGVVFDAAPHVDDMKARLKVAMRDLDGAVGLLLNTSTVRARFEETGILTAETCRELGLVGPPARACGIEQDVRRDFPTGAYRSSPVTVATCPTGDVFARAQLRFRRVARIGPARPGAAGASSGGPGRRRSSADRGPSPSPSRWSRVGAARSATSRSPASTGGSPATRSWTHPSTTGPDWPSPCGSSPSPISRSATRASTCRTAATTCEAEKIVLKAFIERLRQGHRTIRYPKALPALPPRYRGLPVLDPARCPDGCRSCAERCPTARDRRRRRGRGPKLDLGRCLFCVRVRARLPLGGSSLLRATIGWPRERGTTFSSGAEPLRLARARSRDAPAVRQVPEAPPGQRRRVQRLRGRGERAEHGRLRSLAASVSSSSRRRGTRTGSSSPDRSRPT